MEGLKGEAADVLARMPENCLVRLIDLEPGVRGLISEDETGFVNIYINARLSDDGRREALRHELRHYFREDFHSGADIREVERLAEVPLMPTLDETPPSGFDTGAGDETKPLDGGERPGENGAVEVHSRLTGGNLARAAASLRRVRALLLDASHIFDVAQPVPVLPARALAALAEGLNPEDFSPIALLPGDTPLPAALPFCREGAGRLYGTLYYDRRGQLDNALAVFEIGGGRVTVDLRRRLGRLDVCAINAEAEGRAMRVY